MAFIYAIIDNRDNSALYVGITKNMERRFAQHKHKGALSKEEHPFCSIIALQEGCSPYDFETERFWIAYFRFMGAELRNKTLGTYTRPRLLTQTRKTNKRFQLDSRHLYILQKQADINHGGSVQKLLYKIVNDWADNQGAG